MLFLQENILENISATYFMKWISKLCIWKIQSCIRKSLKISSLPENVCVCTAKVFVIRF